ncbi:MAG: o-succinylbenzoate synthase [Prochlorococcus sp. SP3034]|nr:o-succinylbenzoate synthase [Prochlorococcus sp. SP3034]|tara:strand:- start:17228 stop:18193 length:966 start_codon:yes stop_codon:yes gene_type:complete
MFINFEKKYFSFNLSSEVINSKNKIFCKKGWIIKIKNKYNKIGFGEISPLNNNNLTICKKEINAIDQVNNELNITRNIKKLHPCIQSGIKCALAEMKGELNFENYYPFTKIDQTAILLKSNKAIDEIRNLKKNLKYAHKNLTFKWKVGIQENLKEEKILEDILNEIPRNFKLRIDSNGGWTRKLANRWADILKNNKNLDWLEQPLEFEDIEGLRKLNNKVPIALDESLMMFPELIDSWEGWQIRRPSQENNPIKLLNSLINKKSFISLSSSFETGIGKRFLEHCALLQLGGTTPKIPGLAIRHNPESFLFSNNPNAIWEKL